MATTTAQIQQLYVAYLGRAADKAGLDYWSAELNAETPTLTLEDLRANFVNEQPEYAAAYGNLSRVDTVTKIYNNLFGRAPDAAGLTYWTTGGGATVAADDLLVAFINGAAATDAQTITNKVLVAEIYTSTAGDNFLAADATSIVSVVTDNASITTALNKLTDGTLGGIAVPAAVTALKADAAADAAELAFETNNLATLKTLQAELVKLSTTDDKANLITNVAAASATDYDGLTTEIKADIATARTGLDTKVLTTAVATETTELADARVAFLTEDKTVNAVGSIAAYEAAVKAVAANPGAVQSDLDQAVTTFTAYAGNATNATAYANAVAAAGLAEGTTAASIVTTLQAAATTDAQIKQITDAFASITEFSALKTQAGLERSENVAAKAKVDAEANLKTTAGADWKLKFDTLATDTAKLNASKAVDTFEAKFNVTDTAHTALVNAAASTQKVVDASAALTPAVDGNGTAAKTDVFFFASAIKQADDLALNFGAKDTLYLGEGYKLNTTATFDSTTKLISGADNNALEVFFIKDGATVKAVIETNVTGSTTADLSVAGTNATTDNVAVITLSGVTDIAQVSFANGVISHVA